MRGRAGPQVTMLLLLGISCMLTVSTEAAEACAVCPPQDRCVFRVLAVGDSLTRGAVPSTSSAHPYSTKMAEVLRARLGSRSTNKASVQVKTAGENSEQQSTSLFVSHWQPNVGSE